MRAGFSSILLLLLAGATVLSAAAAPAKPPAPPAVSPHQADWDSLRAWQGRGRWAAVESLATGLADRIGRDPFVDSLSLSKAWLLAGFGRWHRLPADTARVPALIERSVGVRDRHPEPGDPLHEWSHLVAYRVYERLGRWEDSRRHAETMVRMDSTAVPRDTVTLAKAERLLATADRATGRFGRARDGYLASIAHLESTSPPDTMELIPALAEYGAFLAAMGEFDEARTWLGRARKAAEALHEPGSERLEGVLARMTTLEDRTGNLAESIELAQRAYEIARRREGEDGLATLYARVRLAYRLAELGDDAASAARLRELMPAYEKALGPAQPQVLNARLALLQSALATGDTAGVRSELAALAPVAASQHRLANSNVPYVEMLSAELQRAAGDDAGARARLLAAVREAWNRRASMAARLAELLTVAMRTLRDARDAAATRELAALQDSLGATTSVRATPEWVDLLAARAAAEAREGLPEAWGDALTASRAARERLRFQVQALSDRSSLQLAERLAGPCDVLASLARDGAPDRVRAAWDEIVRWRGLVRTEVERRRLAAEDAADTAVAGAHTRWIAAQRHLAQLVVSGAAHPDDPASAARFESGRRAADEAERRFMRLLGGPAPDSISLAHVLEHLGAHEALVGYVTADLGDGRRSYGAFVRAPGAAPRYVDLGDAESLERAVAGWVAGLSTPPGDDPSRARAAEDAARAKGRAVRERAWDPVARALGGATKVIVVPEGAIWRVAWAALPADDGLYLAEGPVTLRVLNSEREVLPGTDPPKGRGLLAVGGPDFDLGAPGAGRAAGKALERAPVWPCEPGRGEPLPPLPAAATEAEEITTQWEGRPGDGAAELLVGAAATERAFKADAPGHAVIHLATHGIVVRDTCESGQVAALRGVGGLSELPAGGAGRRLATAARVPQPAGERPAAWLGRRVWLALAGANETPGRGDENEGLLTAEEVATLDLAGADWVVLSACHSGEGAAWANEGQAGMRRAFHLAGARAVIASEWAVADDATREWMLALYAARARGSGAGAAVLAADRATLEARRRDGRTTHPFYWAGFEATGE